jgi:hypothetical protein
MAVNDPVYKFKEWCLFPFLPLKWIPSASIPAHPSPAATGETMAAAFAREADQPDVVAAEKEAAKWISPDNPLAGEKCLVLMKLACGHKELQGPRCMACLAATKEAVVPGLRAACRHKQFGSFCSASKRTDQLYTNSKVIQEALPAAPSSAVEPAAQEVEVADVSGEEASDSCRLELTVHSTCDIDAVQNDAAKCSSCVLSHERKIDAGLVAGSTCTAAKLGSFCHTTSVTSNDLVVMASKALSASAKAKSKEKGAVDDPLSSVAKQPPIMATNPLRQLASLDWTHLLFAAVVCAALALGILTLLGVESAADVTFVFTRHLERMGIISPGRLRTDEEMTVKQHDLNESISPQANRNRGEEGRARRRSSGTDVPLRRRSAAGGPDYGLHGIEAV